MRSVGPYQFVSFIDSGSFGEVWRCTNVVTGEDVACKVIDLKIRKNPQFYSNIKNELFIHSRMAHPGITRIVDIRVDSSYIYVFLELCSMGNLETIVQQSNGLNEQQALLFFRQIMESIKYIHSCGVAHRDITLKNILIGDDGAAKLSDFGLCKIQPDDGLLTTTCGTFVYAPPEILQGKQYDGKKADIWSAGICLYAMTANHFPWMTADNLPPEQVVQETQQQICSGEISYDDSMSPLLRDLLSQMLCVNPEFRPDAEEILAHHWLQQLINYEPPEIREQNSNLISLVTSLFENLDHQSLV